MEIKFAVGEPPSTPTFADVRDGQIFTFTPGEEYCLKIEGNTILDLKTLKIDYVTFTGQDSMVFDVAEIESITLRRVK